MAAATIAVCGAVILAIGVALVVLSRRPSRIVAPSIDETIAELRAAVADLSSAATKATEAADRIDRIPPPPSSPQE